MRSIEIPELTLFEYFDPLSGELPDALEWIASWQLDQARRILKDRSLDDVRAAQRVAKRWCEEASRSRQAHVAESSAVEGRVLFSDAESMYLTRDQFRFAGNKPYQFSAEELLATFALSRIAALVVDTNAGGVAAEARMMLLSEISQALGFAGAILMDAVRRQRLSRAQRSSKSKQYGPMKKWLVQHYRELDSGTSNRAASILLAAKMPSNLREQFATRDVASQLAVWIGHYKKGHLSDVQDLPKFGK